MEPSPVGDGETCIWRWMTTASSSLTSWPTRVPATRCSESRSRLMTRACESQRTKSCMYSNRSIDWKAHGIGKPGNGTGARDRAVDHWSSQGAAHAIKSSGRRASSVGMLPQDARLARPTKDREITLAVCHLLTVRTAAGLKPGRFPVAVGDWKVMGCRQSQGRVRVPSALDSRAYPVSRGSMAG